MMICYCKDIQFCPHRVNLLTLLFTLAWIISFSCIIVNQQIYKDNLYETDKPAADYKDDIHDEDEYDVISQKTREALNLLKECTQKGGSLQIGSDLDAEVLKMMSDSPPISYQNVKCAEALGRKSIIHESICRHRFLWLSGLHYSGTSLTNYILQNFEGISGHYETNVPMDEGQHLQGEFPRDFEFGPMCTDPHAHLKYHMDENHELATDKARACIYTEWAKYWDLSQPVLMEKSPASFLHLRYRQWLFPGVSASIITVRHPLYGCVIHPNKYSQEKFFNTQTIELALFHWLESHRYLKSILPSLERYSIIMFEDFFTQDDPVSELNSIVSSFFSEDAFAVNTSPVQDLSGRRRLPFHGDNRSAPEIDKALPMKWGMSWKGLTQDSRSKMRYENKILPLLQKYENEINEYGYSLLNVLERNVTKFNEKFGRKYTP